MIRFCVSFSGTGDNRMPQIQRSTDTSSTPFVDTEVEVSNVWAFRVP
jgi:hypothetical protein